MGQKVAILGASQKPERYAYRAFKMLQEYGHTPVPITPKFAQIEGVKAYASVLELKEPIDTLTMYVSPTISSRLKEEILSLKPKRVIFNPGSENPELAAELRSTGVGVEEACTLVLLRTQQF
ncbi:MAG: CoA-binding protein [Bdellovibrionales bacterium]